MMCGDVFARSGLRRAPVRLWAAAGVAVAQVDQRVRGCCWRRLSHDRRWQRALALAPSDLGLTPRESASLT